MSGKEKKADSGISSSALPPGTAVSVLSVDLGGEKSSSRRGGFRINVSMERSRPGMLMSVLEVFEALGLDVLDADVSCTDDTPFRLQATGTGGQGRTTAVDEQMVEQAVLQAITKCMEEEDQNKDNGDE